MLYLSATLQTGLRDCILGRIRLLLEQERGDYLHKIPGHYFLDDVHCVYIGLCWGCLNQLGRLRLILVRYTSTALDRALLDIAGYGALQKGLRLIFEGIHQWCMIMWTSGSLGGFDPPTIPPLAWPGGICMRFDRPLLTFSGGICGPAHITSGRRLPRDCRGDGMVIQHLASERGERLIVVWQCGPDFHHAGRVVATRFRVRLVRRRASLLQLACV